MYDGEPGKKYGIEFCNVQNMDVSHEEKFLCSDLFPGSREVNFI